MVKPVVYLLFITYISILFLVSSMKAYGAGGPPPVARPVIHYRTSASATTQVGNLSSPGDFNALMTGQGHSINAMGNTVNEFMQNAKTRGSQLIGNSPNIDSNLTAMYQQAVSNNLNPAIILAIWGVMSHFSINGTEFGRSPQGTGFNTQLSQTVATLTAWMNFFNQNKKNGSYTIKNTTCAPFTDDFIFAYEKFNPFCSVSSGNDTQANFITYYKIFTNQ